jgi:hypothetical protein
MASNEAKKAVQRLHDEVMGIVSGDIPEEAPAPPGDAVASDANRERMKRIMLHAVQVQDGLIPEDSPDDFVLPRPLDDNGLPWFFGPDYNPTKQALDEFSKPP